MQTLIALLNRLAKRRVAHWWAGERPDVRDGQLAKAMAERAGLPMTTEEPFANKVMDLLDKEQAAYVLALAGTTSLAYGRYPPRQQYVMEAKAALGDLAADAVFLSNGRWTGASHSWHSMTSATFDCGLVGFDRENAFIFWVEEED